MATIGAMENHSGELVPEAAPTLTTQLRKFLWVASGMFSTSSLALAFLDSFTAASYDQTVTHFLAAMAAAGLFAVATILKLGPDEA